MLRVRHLAGQLWHAPPRGASLAGIVWRAATAARPTALPPAHGLPAAAVRRFLSTPAHEQSQAPPTAPPAASSIDSDPTAPPPLSSSEDNLSYLDDAALTEAGLSIADVFSDHHPLEEGAPLREDGRTDARTEADYEAEQPATKLSGIVDADAEGGDPAQPSPVSSVISSLTLSPCHPSSLFTPFLFSMLKSEVHSRAFEKMSMRASAAPLSTPERPTWQPVPEWDLNDKLNIPNNSRHPNWAAQQNAMASNLAALEAQAADAENLEDPEAPHSPDTPPHPPQSQEPFSKECIEDNRADFMVSPTFHQCEELMQGILDSQSRFLAKHREIDRLIAANIAKDPEWARSPQGERQAKQWKTELQAAWKRNQVEVLVPLVNQFIRFMEEPMEGQEESALEDLKPVSHEAKKSSPTSLLKTRSGRLRFDPTLAELSNLSAPHEWYPLARSLPRKFIIHVGPTNSGKTYHAMQRLMQARSGLYAGPLRLLAWEVYDKMMKAGVPCNLLTGQEVELTPGAHHASSTVEMVNVSTIIDVAVVDEVQMLASTDRGSAWTRALLGIPAYEIHVCGDMSMVEMVEELCAITGEPVEVREYQRLTPLHIGPPLKNGIRDVQRGDCIVAFSRKQLYNLKKEVEHQHGLKCCIIYGSLPPETRRQQAELFNDPTSGYDVLLASDAIGMGLNLNIARVIFAKMEKFDGTSTRPLTPSETMQIAGRAGRFNTNRQAKKDGAVSTGGEGVKSMEEAAATNQGVATTMNADEHAYLQWAMKQSLPPIERVGLAPTYEQLELLHHLRPKETLSNLMTYFAQYAQLDNLYFAVDMDASKQIADLLEEVPFPSMRERFMFTQAPARVDRQPFVQAAMLTFAKLFAAGETVPVNSVRIPNLRTPNNDVNMLLMESLYQVLDLYVWLAIKFGEAQFVDLEKATAYRNAVAAIIARGLAKLSPNDRWMEKRRNLVDKQLAQQKSQEKQRGRPPRTQSLLDRHARASEEQKARKQPEKAEDTFKGRRRDRSMGEGARRRDNSKRQTAAKTSKE